MLCRAKETQFFSTFTLIHWLVGEHTDTHTREVGPLELFGNNSNNNSASARGTNNYHVSESVVCEYIVRAAQPPVAEKYTTSGARALSK